MYRNVEVLSPAGSFDILKSAIASGADAVYVGGSRFGARAFAVNFDENELLEAIDYVHIHGKKLYLTFNTLIKEEEFDQVYDFLKPYYEQGLDAVIIQDLGLLNYVKRQFPELPIHASTQMTVTNHLSAKYLESLGVERVVPARELSLSEIKDISTNTNLEIECFVHGALCYCYSGQCLLSSMIGGRSGNRGQCAQPCRLPYKVDKNRETVDIMSLKDLCTIKMIPELIEAGITSFKIEGRMKQEEYVSTVTAMYRKYVDLYLEKGKKAFKVTKEDYDLLIRAYQRRGYTDGYYKKQNGKEMISFGKPGSSNKELQAPSAGAHQEPITGHCVVEVDQPLQLTVQYNNQEKTYKKIIYGDIVLQAQNRPLTKDRIEKQLLKTGQSPYKFSKLQVEVFGETFVPMQSLNELRREAIHQLQEEVVLSFRRNGQEKEFLDSESTNNNENIAKYTVSVETLEQFETVLDQKYIARVYVEDFLYWKYKEQILEKLGEKASDRPEIFLSMPRIFRNPAYHKYTTCQEDVFSQFDGIMIRNLESYIWLQKNDYKKRIHGDFHVYQWNKEAQDFWKKNRLCSFTAPLELNFKELQKLDMTDGELFWYGHAPVMVSAGCIQKHTAQCNKNYPVHWLTDRYQKTFFVKADCTYCYNVMYNCDPVILFDQKKEIGSIKPKYVRFSFTTEDKRQVKEIFALFEKVYVEGRTEEMPDGCFTRGHFKRGVK